MDDQCTASLPESCSQQMEELLAVHRRQKKELQGRLLAVRKSFTRPDKKKKKELSEQAEQEEKELLERQQQELADLVKQCSIHSSDQENNSSEQSQDQQLSESSVGENQTHTDSNDINHKPAAQYRITKAQRRRNKKAERSRERESRIAEAEIENQSGPRQREYDAIAAKLATECCQVKLIPSDGNCMYAAVCDQLDPSYTVAHLRRMTAEEMSGNRSEYQCYLTAGDDGDSAMTDAQYTEHVHSVANTTAWGGQVELAALSAALGRRVRVLQADSPDLILGGASKPCQSPTGLSSDDSTPIITLTYHRHMYRLGAHYNSIQRLSSHSNDPDESSE